MHQTLVVGISGSDFNINYILGLGHARKGVVLFAPFQKDKKKVGCSFLKN